MTPQHEHGSRWRCRQQHVTAPGQLLFLNVVELVCQHEPLLPCSGTFSADLGLARVHSTATSIRPTAAIPPELQPLKFRCHGLRYPALVTVSPATEAHRSEQLGRDLASTEGAVRTQSSCSNTDMCVSAMTTPEAFAAIALAAVACDGKLGRDEAHALRRQLEYDRSTATALKLRWGNYSIACCCCFGSRAFRV